MGGGGDFSDKMCDYLTTKYFGVLICGAHESQRNVQNHLSPDLGLSKLREH